MTTWEKLGAFERAVGAYIRATKREGGMADEPEQLTRARHEIEAEHAALLGLLRRCEETLVKHELMGVGSGVSYHDPQECLKCAVQAALAKEGK